ncbi:hypothetical protein HG536_0C00840 [Torulaspora globosa]|uniref:Kinase n=1 Tax=Torulaspora globosa TaxID=48254 RepID=A0A7G3ZEI1_9SACH|nr:uncharacterized protein HG536_0C00840 [Torulaspora globosa]QLL31917.1 hypothetical protein HG536_0C00840 [Torulaspora globosa]
MHQTKELRHKAAGHDGTLTDKDELLVFKPTVQQELDFYKAIQNKMYSSEESVEGDVPLYSWMPTFLGVLDEGFREVPEGAKVLSTVVPSDDGSRENSTDIGDKKYIVLENLLHGFSQPNVLDVKLGKVLYDENASDEKKDRLNQVSRTTTSGSLGFRICGMKLKKNASLNGIDAAYYETDDDDYVFLNKFYGRSRTKENIEEAFCVFFASDALSSERIKKLKRTFHQRLQLLYNTLLEEEVRMISCSLLLIYEGDPERWDALKDQDSLLRDDFIDSGDEGDDEVEETVGGRVLSSLSLIDFAHARLAPGEGYDEGVVDAVENLMTLFHDLCIKS